MVGYFQRWSYLPPPSPTPSHASSTASSISETNTITTTASDIPSFNSRAFLSVFRSSIVFPLSNQAPETGTTVVPPSPNPKDSSNNLFGVAFRVDPASTTTPFAMAANTKNNNNELAWKQPYISTITEYETMPLKRRQQALARVTKLRMLLRHSEESLRW